MKDSVIGTEFKLNIHMEPVEGHHLIDIRWLAEVYTLNNANRKVVIKSENAKAVDQDTATIVVDSSYCGAGRYVLKFTAKIPDADMPDGTRTEIVTVDTGVLISE